MQSNHSSVSHAATPLQKLAIELVTGVGASSLVATLIVGKSLVKTIQDVGVLSEELFRGDRLPVLNFPKETDANQQSD
jgi:hypothetical protein